MDSYLNLTSAPEEIPLPSDLLPSLPVFRSISETERCVDEVAVQMGFVTRVEACWNVTRTTRTIRYKDKHGYLELLATIARRGLLENEVFWSVSCTITRLDVSLSLETRWRLTPSTFRNDIKGVTTRLRALQVYPDRRIIGQLIAWKKEKNYGYLECLPGIHVYIAKSDVGRQVIRLRDWFSFQIQLTPKGRKAVNVRTCPAPLLGNAHNGHGLNAPSQGFMRSSRSGGA